MMWRRWLSFAGFSLGAALAARPAAAQLAPTGGHYAAQPSDTGFAGAVNSSGGYGASVPLDVPGARGGLPIPVQVVYGERGVGAAGLGFDVPLSYVLRDNTIAHRRPKSTSDFGAWQAREAISLVLEGRAISLVPTASGYTARRDAPDILVRQQGDGTWLMFDGQGRTYSFTVAATTGAAAMWLLKSITGLGGSKVELAYSITTPTVPGGGGLAIDLTTVSYNPHPTTANCYKNTVVLGYDSDVAAPLSLSVLGDRILAHLHKLATVDVKSKATCGDAYVRLRGYQFAYTQDADTHLPRLSSVKVVGREGTSEATTPIPLANYTYGRATSSGALRYQLASNIASSHVTDPYTVRDDTLPQANGGVGYSAGKTILDVTGDGLPDEVSYRPDNLLWYYDWMHDVPERVWDSSFPKQPFDSRTLKNQRYQSISNVDRVWRQAIDVNGDGRIDVIDAWVQPGHWVVYLNTPDPSDARFTQWVTRSYSTLRLAAKLSLKGFDVGAGRVPLAQRTTADVRTVKTCWLWERGQWHKMPGGFNSGFCTPPAVSDGLETTFTDWEITDVNGDGYTDVVFNSAPVGSLLEESPAPSDPPPEDASPWVTQITTTTPMLSSSNEIDAVLNVLGVHFGVDAEPFSSVIKLRGNDPCGVARWSPTDDSHQELTCGIIDVNGDGIADRVSNRSVFLGTGVVNTGGFFTPSAMLTLPAALATQINDQRTRCAGASGATTFTTAQTAGLRDLTGDGIPDYFTATGTGAGSVQIGTGTGFLDAIPIDGMFMALSTQDEDCAGIKSTTTTGLFDVDGDGKPDVVTTDGGVYKVVSDGAIGAPEAGRLVQIDNGFGARTSITYRSAKVLASSKDLDRLHQVPFPEIVVSAVQTTVPDHAERNLAATQYAYGGAQLVFDPVADRFVFPGYHRQVTLRVPIAESDGFATITDSYVPKDVTDPLGPGSASLTAEQRYARRLRIGRVSDVTVLAGNVGTDPAALLLADVTSDLRRIGSTHYDWDARSLAAATDAPEFCSEMVYPYDYKASNDFSTVDACRQRGLGFASSVQSFRSAPGADPSSGAAVTTRSEIQTIDDYGRVTRAKQLGDDLTHPDDDLCIDTVYANPEGSNERVLSAASTRTVGDCGTTIYAKDTWLYDLKVLGKVSLGLPTSHTVDRRDEAGTSLGEVPEFDATYDAQGNPVTMSTSRDATASRTVTAEYDAFRLAPTALTTTATGIPSMTIALTRDPVTLNVTSTLDPNGTSRGATFDGFGRAVTSTVTPPGGSAGALSCTSYQGFTEGETGGRRITSKVFTDSVAPATACAAAGRTARVYLDELGRARLTEQELGANYENLKMMVDVTYDSLGRVVFATDPHPSNQASTTAYGTTWHFKADGTRSCAIRGNGKQAFTEATDEANEIYPTCTYRTFQDNLEWLNTKDSASLLTGSPQNGVVKGSAFTATGRLITRSTWKGSTRLEHAVFGHDRLGHVASMTRYLDPVAYDKPVKSSWHFDSLGQLLELDEPDSPAQFNTYSNWGELTETKRTVNGSDKRVVQKYDPLGRLIHSEHQTGGVVDPQTVHDYAYDTAVQVAPQVNATNVLGRLAKASWPTGSVTYSYDGLGRNNAQVFIDAGVFYVEKHTFHDDGSLSALDLFLPDTAQADEHVAYTYDSAGRGYSVNYNNGANSQLLYLGSLDPFGRIRQAQYGAAFYSARYDDVGRRLLKQVTVLVPSGPLRSILYSGFDPVGRERSRSESKSATDTLTKTTWAYDALGRLSSAVQTRGTVTNFNQQFTYDPLGNLLKTTNTVASGTPDTTLTYSTTDRDRICHVAFGADSGTACNVTYDELGSILSQPSPTGSRQYTYQVDGSVRTITDNQGNLATFRYDAFGEVQQLDLGERQDRHYGALFTVRNEKVDSSVQLVLTRKIPLHDGSFATRHGSAGPWTFEYGEQRGNRLFTDEAGTFVQEVDYQPFGKPTSTGAPPGSQLHSNKQWNGGDSLTAFGISQLGARLYDPVIGRFTSRDPLLIPRTAATTNPYAFADNDPVNSSDPTGLCTGLANKDGTCPKESENGQVTKHDDSPGSGSGGGSTGGTSPQSSTTDITLESGRGGGQGKSGHSTGTGGNHTGTGSGNALATNDASARALADIARGQAIIDRALAAATGQLPEQVTRRFQRWAKEQEFLQNIKDHGLINLWIAVPPVMEASMIEGEGASVAAELEGMELGTASRLEAGLTEVAGEAVAAEGGATTTGGSLAAGGVRSLDDLSRAAGVADRGGLTTAGRALQKHGGRPGSAFPVARGTPRQINEAGQHIVDDILTSPGTTTTMRHHARFGDVMEIRAPDGRGVRYNSSGGFIGLLEP